MKVGVRGIDFYHHFQQYCDHHTLGMESPDSYNKLTSETHDQS